MIKDLSEPSELHGLRFVQGMQQRYMPMLKPLGLAMSVARQPRDKPTHTTQGGLLYDLSISDLLQAMHSSRRASMNDCLCNVSQVIGFRDEGLHGFPDVKFCLELCPPMKRVKALPPNPLRLVGR